MTGCDHTGDTSDRPARSTGPAARLSSPAPP